MTTSRWRAGVALLEAMIALAILSVSGLSVVSLVNQLIRTQAEAIHREDTMNTASRVLAVTTLLKRQELDQRLGTREVGEFLVAIQRPEKALYRIAISEREAPASELLVTVVYRP